MHDVPKSKAAVAFYSERNVKLLDVMQQYILHILVTSIALWVDPLTIFVVVVCT
jgi:isochorismate hydrolase